jgi:hypothetical protein
VFSVTLSPATAAAIVLNAVIIAARWALESIRNGIGSRTLVLATFTIRPNPRSRMPGMTRSMSSIWARTSVR